MTRNEAEIFAIMNGIKSDIAPGGSSANTAAELQNSGKAAFIGAVANDDYGTVYINKTRNLSPVFYLKGARSYWSCYHLYNTR